MSIQTSWKSTVPSANRSCALLPNMPAPVRDLTMPSPRLALPGQLVGRRKSQSERFTLLSLQQSRKRPRENSFFRPIVRPSKSLQRKRGLRCYDARCLKSPNPKLEYPKKRQGPVFNSKQRSFTSLVFGPSLEFGCWILKLSSPRRPPVFQLSRGRKTILRHRPTRVCSHAKRGSQAKFRRASRHLPR